MDLNHRGGQIGVVVSSLKHLVFWFLIHPWWYCTLWVFLFPFVRSVGVYSCGQHGIVRLVAPSRVPPVKCMLFAEMLLEQEVLGWVVGQCGCPHLWGVRYGVWSMLGIQWWNAPRLQPCSRCKDGISFLRVEYSGGVQFLCGVCGLRTEISRWSAGL